MPVPTLRIATWNILHALDFQRGCVDLPAVTAGLAALDADVVALQEADYLQPRSAGAAQINELAHSLGYRSVFAPSLWGDIETGWTDKPPVGDSPSYGIALLTRSPLLRWRRVRLPGAGPHERRRPPDPARPGWDHEPRVALQAQLDVGGVMLHIAATHLSYMPWRSPWQLRRVLAAVGDATPAVVLGDLNLIPAAVRLVAPGWINAGGERTFPSHAPRMQLDQILVRGVDVTSVAVAPPGPSDHRALVAEVALR